MKLGVAPALPRIRAVVSTCTEVEDVFRCFSFKFNPCLLPAHRYINAVPTSTPHVNLLSIRSPKHC